MIWIILVAVMAASGLLLLWNEGGSITEEPVVTAVYMVWPLVFIVIICLMANEARKAARDLRADQAECRSIDPPPVPKDLN